MGREREGEIEGYRREGEGYMERERQGYILGRKGRKGNTWREREEGYMEGERGREEGRRERCIREKGYMVWKKEYIERDTELISIWSDCMAAEKPVKR